MIVRVVYKMHHLVAVHAVLNLENSYRKINKFTDHNRANCFKSEGDCLENNEIWNNSSPGKWRKLSFVWTVHIGKISIKFEISTVILMANFQNHLRLIIISCSVTMRNFLSGDSLYHL